MHLHLKLLKALLSTYLIGVVFVCRAQNIETITKSPILKGNGIFSVNQIFNHASGKAPSRNPYSYLINGQLNLKLFGVIDAPFSFMYSNLGNQYTQPTYHQTSIHPTYKWVATHFGAIACNYSSYTVSGHLFQGSAIDLTPGAFSFSAFYGRFQKAIQPGITNEAAVQPAYKRMGGGCKLGYKHEKWGHWAMVLFSAKDQIKSLQIPIVLEPILPQQNWNSSVQMQKSFFKKVNIEAELAYSLLTENLLINSNNRAFINPIQFKNVNASTQLFKAFKSSLVYSLGKGSINIAYQRVDPFYRTLGAYYFNNDLENITAGFSAPLFKQKINLSANAGWQHDNLSKTKLSTMSRFVGNANLCYNPNKLLTINLTYSNFLSYTNVRPYIDYQNQINPYLAWDTLNFRQISQNINGHIAYLIKSDSLHVSCITNTLTYQLAADAQSNKILNSNAFFNASMAYNYSKIKSGESVVLSLNAGRTELNLKELLNISPGFTISKPLWQKQLRTGMSLSYTNSYYDKVSSGAVLNLRGMLNYTYQKAHHFSLSFLILNRKDAPHTSVYTFQQRSNELTISFAYSVNMDFFEIKQLKRERRQ